MLYNTLGIIFLRGSLHTQSFKISYSNLYCELYITVKSSYGVKQRVQMPMHSDAKYSESVNQDERNRPGHWG